MWYNWKYFFNLPLLDHSSKTWIISQLKPNRSSTNTGRHTSYYTIKHYSIKWCASTSSVVYYCTRLLFNTLLIFYASSCVEIHQHCLRHSGLNLRNANNFICVENFIECCWLCVELTLNKANWIAQIKFVSILYFIERIRTIGLCATANKAPSLHSQPQQSPPLNTQKIYAQSSFHNHPTQSSTLHNSDHIYQSNCEVKTSKAKPERIYTSAADRNHHYQQLQHQHYHYQPQQQQQQPRDNQRSLEIAMSSDGNCAQFA